MTTTVTTLQPTTATTASPNSYTRHDLGPLTTLFQPPSRCTSLLIPSVGPSTIVVQEGSSSTYVRLHGPYLAGCNVELQAACLPSSTTTVHGPHNIGIYSPGLFCPRGFDSAGRYSVGMNTESAMQWAEVAGLLREDEIGVVCCPDGYTLLPSSWECRSFDLLLTATTTSITAAAIQTQHWLELLSPRLLTQFQAESCYRDSQDYLTGAALNVEIHTIDGVVTIFWPTTAAVTTTTSAAAEGIITQQQEQEQHPTTVITNVLGITYSAPPVRMAYRPQDLPAASSNGDASRSNSSNLTAGQLAAIIITAILIPPIILTAVFWLLRRRRRRRRRRQQQQPHDSMQQAVGHDAPGSSGGKTTRVVEEEEDIILEQRVQDSTNKPELDAVHTTVNLIPQLAAGQEHQKAELDASIASLPPVQLDGCSPSSVPQPRAIATSGGGCRQGSSESARISPAVDESGVAEVAEMPAGDTGVYELDSRVVS